TLRLHLVGRRVIPVSMALLDQLADRRLVTVQPLRLIVRPMGSAYLGAFVPVEAEPAEAVEDRLQRLRHVTLLIRVVDTENELTAVLAGVEPVEQGGANAADVEETGWTGSKACADHEADCTDGADEAPRCV